MELQGKEIFRKAGFLVKVEKEGRRWNPASSCNVMVGGGRVFELVLVLVMDFDLL